jgi:signal transduction histidine kinase
MVRGLTMLSLRRRVTTLPPLAGDAALALLAALFVLSDVLADRPGPRTTSANAVVAGMLCAAALLGRSRWPAGALVVSGVFGSLFLLNGQGTLACLPAVLIALFSAVAYSGLPRPTVWAIAGGVSIMLLGADMIGNWEFLSRDLTPVLRNTGWFGMALMLGEALRSRHAYAVEAELRAVQAERARHEAERAQQAVAQQRVAEERLQIARELHDVLAHTVAVINIQAGVAAHVLDQQPEQAREALGHIKSASRTTLQELRALVGVLRESDGPAPRAPAPGLDALDTLVATVRDAGLSVELEVSGRNGSLPATVDVAAYRILQEALTNVIKHAGPAPVQVSIQQENGRLKLSVVNGGDQQGNGHGEGTGHGIAGMRERVAALGGSLVAGPLPEGGFRVSAALPIPGGRA